MFLDVQPRLFSLKKKKMDENKLMPPSVCFCLQFASMTASQRRASTISFLTCELLPFLSLPPSSVLLPPLLFLLFSSAMLCCCRCPSYSPLLLSPGALLSTTTFNLLCVLPPFFFLSVFLSSCSPFHSLSPSLPRFQGSSPIT